MYLKKASLVCGIVGSLLLGTFACTNYDADTTIVAEPVTDVAGLKTYRAELLKLTQQTYSRSAEMEPTQEDIKKLVEVSTVFLNENNITPQELGLKEGDERIAIVALAILDYQNVVVNSSVSRTTLGGCVLQALGIKEVLDNLGKQAVKKVATVVAKAALKKAVPWIGWGLCAYELIDCAVLDD